MNDILPVQESATDSAWMHRALSLAERGWGHTAPNPMVGAVVVRDGVVVGEGYHKRYGEAHAEVHALAAAGDMARGATLYVTLEPCNHHGKTPPCTDAILEAGIRRVVMATRDDNPVATGGIERLQAAGVVVETGLLRGVARELNAPFFFAQAPRQWRPWVTLKLAISIDGAIADATRSPGWLTNEASRQEVQRLRANTDAIAVGAGTVLADDPSLTARWDPPPRVPPRRVVFDRQGRVEGEFKVLRDGVGETTVLREPLLDEALRRLHAEGVRSLLVEGGAGMAGTLFERGLVDRLVIFQAPIILGAGALAAFGSVPPVPVASATRYPVVRRQQFGDDLMTVYAVHAA